MVLFICACPLALSLTSLSILSMSTGFSWLPYFSSALTHPICVFVCVCVCIYIYIYIYTHTHIHIHVYVSVCVCACVCMYICQVAVPVQTYYRPRGFQKVEAPRFRDIQHLKMAPATFTLREIFLILISVISWVNPKSVVLPEGLYWDRTSDLLACSVVPEPTAPPTTCVYISDAQFYSWYRPRPSYTQRTPSTLMLDPAACCVPKYATSLQ